MTALTRKKTVLRSLKRMAIFSRFLIMDQIILHTSVDLEGTIILQNILLITLSNQEKVSLCSVHSI